MNEAQKTWPEPVAVATGDALASADHLLGDGRYEQAAALVGRVRVLREAAGDGMLGDLLSEAHKLCLACAHHRARAESQRRAACVSEGLERRQRNRIRVILEAAASVPAADLQTAPAPARAPRGRGSQVLAVQCLGHFAVHDGDRALGPWPNRRAKAVFKYLVLHRARPVRKEVLMEVFWPDADAGAARNSLNVAIHSLRRFLREVHAEVSHVVFEDGSYMLDELLPLWVDAEEWERLAASGSALDRSGRTDEAMADFRAAEALYQGGLFEDDPYEDWVIARRRELQDAHVAVLERLRDHYLAVSDHEACVAVAREILALEPSSEDTHRVLMRCYAREGHHHLALRQYQDCARALHDALGALPDAATEGLHASVRSHAVV